MFCVINGMGVKMRWFNGILIVLYLLSFVTCIEMNNYKMIDKIYSREDDKKRAKLSFPITGIYTWVLCVGIGITNVIFEVKGIENNTLPAVKICVLLLLGIMSVTIGFLIENSRIKRWNPAKENYKITKVSMVSLIICVALYGIMCIA